MELLRIIGIYPETISDGYGLRYAIYFAGCAHRCPLEECLADPARRECLRWIDTLVDGRYVEALRDLSLDFRGSSNQRIIDVGALHLFG